MGKFSHPKILEILERYKDIASLESLKSLAEWDLETYMPENAAEERGKILGRIDVLTQKLFLDPQFKKLVQEEYPDLNIYEKAVLRILRREIKILEKLPPEFIEEFKKTTTEASVVWRKAKQENNFDSFAPYLQKIIDLVRKEADYLGFEDHPYSALIDLYEEGWTVSDFENFFESIKNELKELLNKIKSSSKYTQKIPLEEEKYEKEKMQQLNEYVLKLLNFDEKRLRIDISAHPFETAISLNDVRITTWYHPQDFRRSLSAVIHEFGHALYELNSDPEFSLTPLQGGVSYGVHESQSRFWENIIGRNPAFLNKIYPRAKELLPFLEKYSFDDFVFYFNFIRPDFIRVEADELTYHFHIILRFEIEKKFLEGNLNPHQARDLWQAKMKEYLEIEPPNDTLGILQDIHWSLGYLGYFPTYSLGTFLSAIWKEAIEKDLGKIEDVLKEADGILKIQNWLKEKIHQHGKTYQPKELIKLVSGKEFNPNVFIDYLKTKYERIYF